ncbi:LacI family DNA-binding transcriptional regulator [Actinocatenispora thailandica]|uniref:LacI family DNA-binding transcriptional regulator n=1 Tax=Actinocatenispora thailandica TaxID=227318 RepID=UPI0031DF9062
MSPPPRRHPTLDDVAAAAGVSRATVSNAYNRPDQLSAALRGEILRVARRLGYPGPHPVARSLAARRSGALAFLLDASVSTAFCDPALSITLDALATAVAPDALLLVPGGAAAPAQLREAHVDCAVAYSLPDRAPVLRAVRERGLPLVVLDGPARRGATLVRTDDRAGAAAAARHVVELGHRDVTVLGTPLSAGNLGGPVDLRQALASRYRVDRERYAGYREVLAGAGIEPAVWVAAGISRPAAARTAAALLTTGARPTAVLCLSDELAAGVLDAARRLGLRVPDQLTVVGFDDTPTAGSADPALSTVRQDLTAKGRLASGLAAELRAGRHPHQPAPLPVTLVVRDSSAAPPR